MILGMIELDGLPILIAAPALVAACVAILMRPEDLPSTKRILVSLALVALGSGMFWLICGGIYSLEAWRVGASILYGCSLFGSGALIGAGIFNLSKLPLFLGSLIGAAVEFAWILGK
jgi:hypothetical protein